LPRLRRVMTAEAGRPRPRDIDVSIVGATRCARRAAATRARRRRPRRADRAWASLCAAPAQAATFDMPMGVGASLCAHVGAISTCGTAALRAERRPSSCQWGMASIWHQGGRDVPIGRRGRIGGVTRRSRERDSDSGVGDGGMRDALVSGSGFWFRSRAKISKRRARDGAGAVGGVGRRAPDDARSTKRTQRRSITVHSAPTRSAPVGAWCGRMGGS
jgi:hypothetical protein